MILKGKIATEERSMILKGKLAAKKILRGKISGCETIYIDAYELAVLHGFKGTPEEWLESLKPVAGKDYFTDEDKQAIVDYVVRETLKSTAQAAVGYVTILASKWVGNASPYSQVVTVQGATENSQVDLTPSVEQLAIFHEKDLAFVTENEDGVVTVYAVGQKPENDYTIQVTITEVVA